MLFRRYKSLFFLDNYIYPDIISQTLFFIYLCLIGDIFEYKYFSTSHRLLLHLNLHYRSLWNSSLLLFLSHLFVFTCIHSRNRDMSHRIIIRQIDTIFSLTYTITINFTSFLIQQCMYRLTFWSFFTFVIFVAFIRFHMHTFTQQRHEPPHYNTTNRYNLFTDIHHYNSFHIVPNSTITFWSFWTHPSVFDLVHLYFIRAILALWSYFFWLVRLSLTPAHLLWLSLIWTSDPSAALKNLPPFTGWSSHSTKPGCNSPILTISFPHWHLLAFPFWTLLVLLVMVVVLLSFINHSSKSNHSVLETFLLLSLLNSWQLNLLLATKKLSFLISIVLHLLESLPFLTNSKTFLNFLFLYLLKISSLATSTFILTLTWQHQTNFLAFLTTSISNSTYIFLLMMTATLLIFL